MAEVNLLDKYPKIKRNLDERAASTDDDRQIAKQFGKEYFDGTRSTGYGGYRYDGRWKPVVAHFIEHYGLTNKSRILDIGCAKGFMLHDFKEALPDATVAGIDISTYAIENSLPSVKPFVKIGNAIKLPYPDKSFDLVIAINTLHNLKGEELNVALREMERVSAKDKYTINDAYLNDEERAALMKWNLTAVTILHRREWEKLFSQVGYSGDYYWFTP
ncbi:MAG: class I SAM-dependent methyltransferase [Oligoflexia bacterium]|nr:class I SAM-dependent methyltransferase [Oligoflexia bacterium]